MLRHPLFGAVTLGKTESSIVNYQMLPQGLLSTSDCGIYDERYDSEADIQLFKHI
jgi:hypothetical protein